MKRIILILFITLMLVSCTPSHTFVLNDDGSLTMDTQVFYPLANSYRFTDYGHSGKQGEAENSQVYVVDGAPATLLLTSGDTYTYYVTEPYKDMDKPFEECEEFFFVPKKAFDKKGRVDKKYAESAVRLTGDKAEDFAFYVFYGRTPSELGYGGGSYVGEIYADFSGYDSLVCSYPVYQYASTVYSVDIDGTEYVLDDEWARKIGIY